MTSQPEEKKKAAPYFSIADVMKEFKQLIDANNHEAVKKLLEQSPYLLFLQHGGHSPFYWAMKKIVKDNVTTDLLKELCKVVKEKYKHNSKIDFMSAIHLAEKHNKAEIVRELFFNLEIDSPSETGQELIDAKQKFSLSAALFEAIYHTDIYELENLLKQGAPVDIDLYKHHGVVKVISPFEGFSPLHLATLLGSQSLQSHVYPHSYSDPSPAILLMGRLLLNYRANPNAIDKKNRLPIHWAIMLGSYPWVSMLAPLVNLELYRKYLIESGYNTGLNLMLKKNGEKSSELMQFLVNTFKEDVNTPGSDGLSPLDQVHPESRFARELLDYGARHSDPQHEEDEKKNRRLLFSVGSAFSTIKKLYKPSARALFDAVSKKDLNEIEELAKRGVPVNIPADKIFNSKLLQERELPKGFTPLHLAVREDKKSIVHSLLEQGADKNLMDEYQRLPIHIAISQGSYKCAMMLVPGLATKLYTGYLRDSGYNTGLNLMFAEADSVSLNLLQLLVEILHEDVNLPSKNGQTPLSRALNCNMRPAIIWQLLDYGAKTTKEDFDKIKKSYDFGMIITTLNSGRWNMGPKAGMSAFLAGLQSPGVSPLLEPAIYAVFSKNPLYERKLLKEIWDFLNPAYTTPELARGGSENTENTEDSKDEKRRSVQVETALTSHPGGEEQSLDIDEKDQTNRMTAASLLNVSPHVLSQTAITTALDQHRRDVSSRVGGQSSSSAMMGLGASAGSISGNTPSTSMGSSSSGLPESVSESTSSQFATSASFFHAGSSSSESVISGVTAAPVHDSVTEIAADHASGVNLNEKELNTSNTSPRLGTQE